jgi:hypothetical protein
VQYRYLWTAAIALLPTGAAAQVLAPAVPQGVGVADRARPDYQPIGGRLGSFFLYPTVSLTGSATDNVRATDLDKRGDAYAVAKAEAKLQSNWSAHALDLDIFASRSQHASVVTENASQYGGQLDGRFDLGREGAVSLMLRGEHAVEDRDSYSNPTNALRPVRYGRQQALMNAAQGFGRLTVNSSLSYTRYRFEDTQSTTGALLSQRFRNLDMLAVTASAAYELSPGYALLLFGAADRSNYTLSARDPLQPGGLNRDSSGGRIEAGVKLSLTSLLYGQLRAGYLVRHYADPRFPGASGTSFGADILWNVTPLTTLKVTADRRVDEAFTTNVAGNRVTELTGGVDHELLRNLILSGSLRYADIEPLGPVGTSSEVGGRVGAVYLADRRLSLRANYAWGERSAVDPARTFHENRGTVGAQLAF